MPKPTPPYRELPPTAGLPPSLGDYPRQPAESFAAGLSRRFGLPDPILACSGTAALVVALVAFARREPGRRDVIVPAYTCPLVPLAVSLASRVIRSARPAAGSASRAGGSSPQAGDPVPGLRVVLCDTRPGGFDFDADRLRRLCGADTLAIIPTHLGGRVADVETAVRAAGRCGAFVIEDAAQALGALEGSGRNVGPDERGQSAGRDGSGQSASPGGSGQSVGLSGDAGFFSLAAGKGLSTFEGGVLVSRDAATRAELAATAAEILRPRPLWSFRRNVEMLAYTLLYNPRGLRFAYGRPLRQKLDAGDEAGAVGDRFSLADIPLHSLDAVRQRVAANALARLPDFLEAGRGRAMQRIKRLNALPGVTVIGDAPGAVPGDAPDVNGIGDTPGGRGRGDTPGARGVWPFFMLLMPDRSRRDEALRRLWRKGLGVSKLFARALPDYDFLAPLPAPADSGGEDFDCPNARDLAGRMLTVSNTHWMSDAEFTRIVTELEMSL